MRINRLLDDLGGFVASLSNALKRGAGPDSTRHSSEDTQTSEDYAKELEQAIKEAMAFKMATGCLSTVDEYVDG